MWSTVTSILFFLPQSVRELVEPLVKGRNEMAPLHNRQRLCLGQSARDERRGDRRRNAGRREPNTRRCQERRLVIGMNRLAPPVCIACLLLNLIGLIRLLGPVNPEAAISGLLRGGNGRLRFPVRLINYSLGLAELRLRLGTSSFIDRSANLTLSASFASACLNQPVWTRINAWATKR